MRIGLVGTESDHAGDFLRLINAMGRSPGDRIVAIWGEDAARTQEVVERFGQIPVAGNPVDFRGDVDAAVIVARDGNRHLELARPFIEEGMPVFIDKPLACSVADARAILNAAKQSGSRVMSASALRWQPDTEAVERKVAALGGPISVTATGTFYPDSPYGGSFFYGIHAAELAVQFAGGAVEDITVERAGPSGVVVRCRAGKTDVAMRLVPPATPDDVTFHVEVVCDGGIVESVIGLGDDYMAPVIDRFLTMAHKSWLPLSEAEQLAPIMILEAGEAALRAGR
jgi:predicted dehydrogenase